MSDSAKPVLAITMGDPAGIGPEVVVGAWRDERVHEWAQLLAIGHPEILRRAARLLNWGVDVVEIQSSRGLETAAARPSTILCLKAVDDAALDVPPGRVDARAGEAAYQAVRCATELAIAQEVDGIVTAPLSKAALHAAGHIYPGHTELLAEMCSVSEFAMMLYLSREHKQGAGSKK